MNRKVSHYQILQHLAAGGMGEVYKAEDTRLRRIVALKILPSTLLEDEQARQRLTDEAQRAASLNHPNIATIYELGQQGGLSFIAMEYVEGETLAEKISREPLEISTAIEIAIQVAEALGAAHKRGVVHCDIKSGNIMLTRDGMVKVLDFGLARSRVEQAGSLLSRDGVTSGTLSYMSPEQLRGEPLDERTDIFSLGVVLYEMIAGRKPFQGESVAAARKATLSDEPPPLGASGQSVPLDLENIVRKTLAKNRERRYNTTDEVLTDLRRLKMRIAGDVAATEVISASVAEAPAYGQAAPRFPWVWSYRKWFLAAASLLAAAAVVQAAFFNAWTTTVRLLLIAFICFLAYATARRRSSALTYSVPSEAAFRGLLPFHEADRDRFYGRGSDQLALYQRVANKEFRFGVLFGESGCGKTSLLRAGLIPKLWDAGYVPIYCRSYRDPVAVLLEECQKQTQLKPLEGEDTVSYLRRVAEEMNSQVVIIFDQFEEFFINFRVRREREPFISFVTACHNDSRLAVKFLLSMRSDFLYLVNAEFADRIEEPLMSSRLYHLRNFDEAQAAEVIERSAQRANLPFEAGLSLQVARDLAAGDSVLPSELQIVGERLQSKRIYTVQAYRRAGGKEPLVYSFLDDVIEASGEQEGARLLLRSLISDENTRLTLPLDEIAKRTQHMREEVERLLNLFVQSRLIREIQDEDLWRYELMHEYLIEKINQITGRVMDATQRANRLFRQYLSSYSVDRRTRIPIIKLLFIRRYSDLEWGERERALLKKSLRWGFVKSSALGLLLLVMTVGTAAWLSVSEEWEAVRLSDGHTAAVRRVAFSPDGRLLVSVGEDKQVIVWDFARRERLATFNDHTDWITSVAFSPDGKWFATSSNDRTVIVWDAKQLKEAAVLRGHLSDVNAVSFSPDGRLLASSEGGNETRNDSTILWSVGSWQKIAGIPKRANDTNSLLFSPDSKRLMFHGDSLNTWDVTTGRPVGDKFDPAWEGSNAVVSPDGTHMVSVNGAGEVIFVDLLRGQTLNRYPAHQDNGRAAVRSPDGHLVATGAEIVILWDAATRQKIAPLEYPSIVWSATFSPDGRWLVSTHGDGSIQIWDVAERQRAVGFNEHSGPARAVAYARDGKRIASAGEDRSVIIWNVESGRKEAVLVGHPTRVVGVAFSPDGSWIATVDRDGLVIIWDVAQRQPRLKFRHPRIKPDTHCLTISPDGRFVATSHGVYESATGRQVADYGSYPWFSQSQIYGVAFSADGKWLAHAQANGYLVLWDTATWRVVDHVEAKPAQLISVSFSPDGKMLATGEDQGVVRLWSTQPLRQVRVLGQHEARIKSVAFSPDGKQVASASDDRTIALWDVTGGLITRIGTHTAPVLSVAFSPDGKRLVSGEHDNSVRLYTRHQSLWGYRLD